VNPLYGDFGERVIYEPPGPWRLLAACRGLDPNLFVPERGEDSAEAKKVCRTCPSIHECVVYGISNATAKGVWGGLSEDDRREARKLMGRMDVCAECDEPFHTYRPTERYCGDGCRRRVRLRVQAASHRRRDVA
jgi:WhiB family transcriptional regulator, redox-sensing transcriptional regulator